MHGLDYLLTTFGGAIALLMVFTLILWTFLPFEIFGMKKRLDLLARRQKRTNELLEAIAAHLEKEEQNMKD